MSDPGSATPEGVADWRESARDRIGGVASPLLRHPLAAAVAVSAMLVAGCALLLLTGLSHQPLVTWDEARLAVNAFEMRTTGDWIVTRFDGLPDLWNTKPPLMIWLEATLLGVVAPAELALRLPAVVATTSTVLLVFWFLWSELSELAAATLAALILLATPAFIGYHAGRSGDYDSLLVLWTTVYSVAWYRYCRSNRGMPLALFGGALALAMLTKGVAGLLMTPGLILFTALERRLATVLRDGRAWAAALGALLVPLAWYAIREAAAPGYVAAVLLNEPGSFFTPTDGTHASPFYLLWGMLDRRLGPWALLLPPSLVLVWLVSHRLARWTTCLLVGFFLVADSSSTKLSWYDLPSYPIVAIVIGAAIGGLLSRAADMLAPGRRWVVAPALLGLVALPLFDAARSVIEQVDWRSDTRLDYGEAFERIGGGAVTVLDGGIANTAGLPNYNASLQFYAEQARQRGLRLRIVHPGYRFARGETFLTCDPQALEATKDKFDLRDRSSVGPCTTARVAGELAPIDAASALVRKR